MQPITQQQINAFLSTDSIAIAGASRNPKSFSASVAQQLSALKYKLWLVNPMFERDEPFAGKVTVLQNLPATVKHLLILTPATETESVVEAAIKQGITHIWIQQSSETPAAIESALRNGVNLIHHQCIFMFANPTGLHKFHRSIKQLFGAMPK